MDLASERCRLQFIHNLEKVFKQLADFGADKLTREKRVLEERLARLGADGKDESNGSKAMRRPYPKVARPVLDQLYRCVDLLGPVGVGSRRLGIRGQILLCKKGNFHFLLISS